MEEWFSIIFPFLCVVLRTAGLFITAPVLGARYVPVPVKAGISLIAGYVLWPSVPVAPLPASIPALVGPALGEIAFGLLLGFIAGIIISAVEMAGQVADMMMGFGLSNVMDPSLGQSVPIMGTFKHLMITLMFLIMNGHHLFIKGLWDSFSLVPAGGAFIPIEWAAIGLLSFGKMLWIAVVLSCPIWASALIVDMSLGMIARTVPQMNVFVVGMPIKALVGLGIMSASIAFYGIFTKEITETIGSVLGSLLGALAR